MPESDLSRKLGIKPGQRVCLLDAPGETASAIRLTLPEAIELDLRLEDKARYDVILFWPQALAKLTGQFAGLQRRIQPDGAIWAVIPKKKYAHPRGIDFSWEQMQAAGLATDLVDNKIASINDEDYGTRFVIRKHRRGDYAD
jgi:hypothetical protein